MTALKFCNWINTDILPNADSSPILPQSIKERTAIKWLHELGFRSQKYKERNICGIAGENPAESQPTGNMLRSRDLIAEDTPMHSQILFQSQSFKKSY